MKRPVTLRSTEREGRIANRRFAEDAARSYLEKYGIRNIWQHWLMRQDSRLSEKFCGLIFAIPDDETNTPCPVFRDADGIPRRACWSCNSQALRLVHAEGRIHGQLALVTAADVAQHEPAKVWQGPRRK